MKRILVISVMVVLLVPAVSSAGSRFGEAFESGAGWELGRLAADIGVALVGGALGGTYYTGYHQPIYYYERPVRYYRVRYWYGRRSYRRGYRHGFRDGYLKGYDDGYFDGSYGYPYRGW